jgi:stage II sporulation protein D
MFALLPRSTASSSHRKRLLCVLVALLLSGLMLLLPAPPARAETVVPPQSGSFTIRGSGWGHGWGMSQYGAYGAARQGRSWQQILAFYYPGTTRTTLRAGSTIRVWVSADSDGSLRVRPAAGLTVRDGRGGRVTLPTGSAYTSWQISRSGTGFRLSYRTPAGTDVVYRTVLSSTPWSFFSTGNVIAVVLPSGTVRSYRGSVGLIRWGGGARTVNRVLLEDYVQGVVPAEMPTSWAAHAVRAQAVAARSYAVRLRETAGRRGYDVCDTTACQVYRGRAAETAAGNAAVRATAGIVLTYRGAVALTQYASSNGGHSARGDYPYLAAKPDPYDGVVRSQSWSRTLTAAQIANRYPSVGTVRSLQVVTRDGAGAWGGRVRTIRIVGSRATVTVSGSSFQYRFGLRSTLFQVVAASAPANPQPTVVPGIPYATFPRSFDARSQADLVLVSPSGQLLRYPVVSGRLSSPVSLGSGFKRYSHVTLVGDWDGDGYGDVVVRTYGEQLLLRRGGPNGQLAAGTPMPGGSGVRTMAGIGDVNWDSRPDLAMITAAGDLWISYGDGRVGRSSVRKISSGWGSHDWLRAPGDFNRDGRDDLISKQGDRLLLHRGTATGFAPPVTLASGWSGFASVTSIGDFTGDGRADLVARSSTGQLVVFAGNGRDRVTRAATLAGSFTGTRFAV